MPYDNKKLRLAMKRWLASSCTVGYGEELAANLLASFEDHCKRTGDMKRSPGRVVFGQQLRELKMDRRKLAGLTHWSGLTLRKKPKTVKPKMYKKTEEALEKTKKTRQKASESKAEKKTEAKEKATASVKKRMARETAKAARAVGGAAG